MRALLLTGIVAATAAAAPPPGGGASQPAVSWPAAMGMELGTPPPPADTARVKLVVRGMTCGSCALTARLVLQRVDGVYRADVSYDSASAVVWYDSARTSPDLFILKLREMTGYDARVAKEPPRKEPPSRTE